MGTDTGLLGVVNRFEGLEAPASKPHGSRTDDSTHEPQRRCELDRIEVQPEVGHQVIPIGEQLGPLTLQPASTRQGHGHSELFDEYITVDADHPGTELDSLDMGEDPVEPTTHSSVATETHTKQLDRAIFCKAGDDPVEIPGLQSFVELRCGRTDRRLRLNSSSVSAALPPLRP